MYKDKTKSQHVIPHEFPPTNQGDFWFSLDLVSEKAMAPNSSTLAWKIPWKEEPGRLQTMGLRRVGHDWNDLAAAADFSTGVWALESPRLYLGYMPIMLLFLMPVSEPQITLGSLTQTLPKFGPLIRWWSSLWALSLFVSLPHTIVNTTHVYQSLWEKHSFQYS